MQRLSPIAFDEMPLTPWRLLALVLRGQRGVPPAEYARHQNEALALAQPQTDFRKDNLYP
jgi:hypothetical protein